MALSPQFLDELRARTTLSVLIGRTVKLQRAGREFRACCPFHNEKSPSFYVNDEKGFYHCFGCGAHGDAIRWMTDQRGLPFMDAVKELAQVAGMDVPAPDRRSAERAERAKGLHEAMADAATWFTEQLHGIVGAEAREVLKKRGISAETARAFGLGYAPDSRGKLKDALKEYSDPLLVEAGLLVAVEEKAPYDRFRGRLMIPINDPRGRPIAFGGRIIGAGEPKYLNSPETPLFDKGRTLYNLDRALPAARRSGRIVAVEGYMDVMILSQSGIAEVVAPLGTALTEHQIERLWQINDVPTLCFDGDAAGQKAAMRAAERALPKLAPGKSLKFASLPSGYDPDDFVREEGRASFENVLNSAAPLSEKVYQTARLNAVVETPEGRAGLRQSVLVLAEKIEDRFVQAEYRRSMNDLFFEDFGWRRSERKVIGTAVIQTGPNSRKSLMSSYYRSALYGLARFPIVLSLMLEPVSSLRITDERLLPWHETLVEAVIERPTLDQDALQSILLASRLKPQTRFDIQTDLRFPWHVDPAAAVRTLGGMIEFLLEEQSLLSEIEDVARRVSDAMTSEEYLLLDQRRSELYAAKMALYERATVLGGLNDAGSSE